MPRQSDIIWPSADYREEQYRADIARVNREARRDAAKRRRENRRWWATRLPIALVFLAAVVLCMWALVPR